ncbi:uncharacterized protein LOC111914361 isoform X1 [Lactuca sativa]|uniref:uncharacterized protein LOC111914361 isoform X1 n=1 Tax=Lactuca sativa TaxID=4236 RepID=UPI001C69023D|nr:uncharacterized protein LOC111914361 isoform X1 [Lactuca sativa]
MDLCYNSMWMLVVVSGEFIGELLCIRGRFQRRSTWSVVRDFCLLNRCYEGFFEGDLQYHEVPQVETLPDPAKVGPVFKGDVPPIEAGVKAASPIRGTSVASGQVVSQRWSAAVDSTLEEDIGGNIIDRRLCRKRNIDPLLAKSLIVIEIAYGDDPQAMETAGLRRMVSPSSLSALGVYLPGWNLTLDSLLLEQGPAREWCRHAFPSATL